MAMRAVFTHDGIKYHFGQLRVREIEELEDMLGVEYADMHPSSRMGHRIAVSAVFLRRTMSEGEVTSFLDKLTREEMDGMWSVEDDDLPTAYGEGLPLSEGERSTD